jgi:hypothetical protein
MCLDSFTKNNILRVHPHCSIYQYYIPFSWASSIPPRGYTSCSFVHMLVMFDGFCFLATMNNGALLTSV